MASNVIVNWEAINKKLYSSSSFQAKALPVVKNKFRKHFTPKKAALLEEFNSNLITQEIAAGSTSSNLSHLLGNRGNLFSYIGFDEGERPITRLRNLLNKIEFSEPKLILSKRVWEFKILIPNKEQVAAVTQVEWMGGAGWVDELEKGMTNLGHYWYNRNGINFGDSRSRTGIQMDAEIYPGAGVVKSKYLSAMLANFRRSLRD